MPAPFEGCRPSLLILDVDGVLTDNRIWLNGDGEEWKAFHVPDGTGIVLMKQAGVELALLSGRASGVVHRRAEELGIQRHLSGIHTKESAVDDILAETGIDAKDTVYVGDDLIDLPPMRKVGLPVAVANAHPMVKETACAVTRAEGGRGAVREVCEWILHARGEWSDAVRRYLP